MGIIENKGGSNNREKNFVRSMIILIIGTVVPKFASFVTLPLYTAYLTKAEYGKYDLILTLCSLFIPIATLMTPSACFRFLLECRDNDDKKSGVITNSFVIMFFMTGISLVALFFILYNQPLYLRFLICIYLFFDALLSMFQQIARGLSKNHIYSISAIILSFGNMFVAVLFLVIINLGIGGVVFSLTASTVMSAIYIFSNIHIFKYISFSVLDKELSLQILRYSWPFVPNNVSSWAMNMSDRFVVLYFLGVEQNAVLAVAHKIPQILLLAQNAYTMAWQENAAISVNDSDIAEYYSKMFSILYRFMFCAAMVLIALTRLLFVVLIHGDYDEAFYQIPIYFFAFFLSCISTYLGGIYLAYKKSASVSITTVVSAVINFVVNVILIRHIGLYAASISTVCGYAFIDIYRFCGVRKIVNLQFNVKEIIIGLFFVFVSGFLCYFKNTYVDIFNVFLGVVVCFVFNKEMINKLLILPKNKIRK